MGSLRTLLFLVGTALVSGSEVKINQIYRLPAEFAAIKTVSFGMPNMGSLIPLPMQGTPGYLPIRSRGEWVDCDHPGYIISEQPASFKPILEAQKIIPILPDFVEKAKTLGPIPKAPVLPPLVLPELPLNPSGEYIKTVEVPKVGQTLLAPLPEAPILPPFISPDLPLKVSVEEPAPLFIPIKADKYYINTPEGALIEKAKLLGPIPEAPILPPNSAPIFFAEPKTVELKEFKPLVPIPEAPVLPPFSLPELPMKIAYESAPCPPEGLVIKSEKLPKLNFGKINPLAIPEAPLLGLYPFPEQTLKVSAPELAPAFIPFSSGEYYIPEAPIVEEKKPLAPIPEAPVLPPLTLPEIPMKVSVPESFIVAVPETGKFEEIKPFAPIPEVPVLPSLTFTDGGYYMEAPKVIEEIKPLAPIPEAPVLGPYTLPELPLKVSVKDAVECAPEELIVESPKELEYIENNKLTILEAPVLPPLVLPKSPTKAYEEPAPVFYLPEAPAKIFESEKIEVLKPIPAAPELPPLAINYKISPISNPIVTKIVEEPVKIFHGGIEYSKLSSPEFCVRTILNERLIHKFAEKGGINGVQPLTGKQPEFVMYVPTATNSLPVYSS